VYVELEIIVIVVMEVVIIWRYFHFTAATSQVSDSFGLFPCVGSSPYSSLDLSLLTSINLYAYYTWCGPPPCKNVYTTHMHLYTTQMGCIASVFALYVPHDFSLHTQLTALESYGLRYTTPLLTLVVAPVAMRIK